MIGIPSAESEAMRKLCGLVVLALVLGVLASGGPGPAEAQDKTKKMKEKEKDKKDAATVSGTVEIYKDKGGAYRFRVRDAGNRVLAQASRGHDSKEEVMKDLEAIQAILAKSKPKDVKD